ncbi:MAG TPA: copper resistance CopC family protein [Usitatibacter sp.]|nr:copper resistance CopC family protein [Usitatibacter sp.]
MNAATRALRSVIAVVALVAAHSAFAHAFLDHADPRVGSTVDQAPKRVTLWFTQELEPAFSKVKVLDAKGNEVDAKDGAVDAKDHTVMHASVRDLAPGKYRVEWRVLSTDTHVTNGNFTFEVRR